MDTVNYGILEQELVMIMTCDHGRMVARHHLYICYRTDTGKYHELDTKYCHEFEAVVYLWVGLVGHRPYQLYSTQFCHFELLKLSTEFYSLHIILTENCEKNHTLNSESYLLSPCMVVSLHLGLIKLLYLFLINYKGRFN